MRTTLAIAAALTIIAQAAIIQDQYRTIGRLSSVLAEALQALSAPTTISL